MTSGRLVVVTCHRRESFGAPVRAVCEELLRMSRSHPALQFVVILHPNPQKGSGPERQVSYVGRGHHGSARALLDMPRAVVPHGISEARRASAMSW